MFFSLRESSSLVCASAWLACSLSVAAAPKSITVAYSSYEEQAIHDAEVALGARVDPAPEGKIIERFDFVRLDPIDKNDPLPMAIDAVHFTSRPSVIQHELLVAEGDRWSKTLVDESARNLRVLPQLSLVLCVPLTGSQPDRVRLVVITKDIWSLFVDFSLQSTPGGLELLDLEPKEQNIYGLHHSALLRFILQPRSYSIGADYEVPRLAGQWLDLRLDGNLIINRDTQSQEGSYGSVSLTRPLFSALTEWAWSSAFNWADQIDRRYVNAAVTTYTPIAPGMTPVPWQWREVNVTEQTNLTRSTGWEIKNDFTLGAVYSHSSYRIPADPALDASSIAQFQSAEVPVGENRAGPYLQWHGYTSNFLRIFDFDTLGLQEDYRLGHDLWLRTYPVLGVLGSARSFLGTYAAASWSAALADGLWRVSLESTVEAASTGVSDASFQAGVGLVTPRLLIGRLVLTGTLLDRVRNYLNAQSSLGGDSLLRGYPSRYFLGKDLLAANLEFRTRSLSVASIQLGAAAFFDLGNAFDTFDHLQLHQSLGLGLRAVFPQLERAVLRFDLGFPVSARPLPADVPHMSFFFTFHQAVLLPVVGSGRGP